MILNTISHGRIYQLKTEEYFYYLEYLKTLGFDYDLLDCFATIYSNQDNKNPLEYLDQIPTDVPQANLAVFNNVYRKKR